MEVDAVAASAWAEAALGEPEAEAAAALVAEAAVALVAAVWARGALVLSSPQAPG